MNFKHGLMQLFISIDQLANVLTNPFSEETWADETLSSRCGRLGHRYPYKFWKAVIDAIFSIWQGPDHCVNAFQKETARYNSPPIMRPSASEAEAQAVIAQREEQIRRLKEDLAELRVVNALQAGAILQLRKKSEVKNA